MALPCQVSAWLAAGEIGLATIMALSESSGHGLVDAGNYDYCYLVNPGNMQICLVYAAGASLGVCVPSSCSQADFADVSSGLPSFVLSQSSVVALLAGGNATVLAESLAKPGSVSCGNNEASWTGWRIVVVVAFSVLALVCTAATTWLQMRRSRRKVIPSSASSVQAKTGEQVSMEVPATAASRASRRDGEATAPRSPQEPGPVPASPVEAAASSIQLQVGGADVDSAAPAGCGNTVTAQGALAAELSTLPVTVPRHHDEADTLMLPVNDMVSPLRARKSAASTVTAHHDAVTVATPTVGVCAPPPLALAGAADGRGDEGARAGDGETALRAALLGSSHAPASRAKGSQRLWKAARPPELTCSCCRSGGVGALARIAAAFDLQRNWNELLRVQPHDKDAFPLIHFLRVISSAWVIAGHAALLWLITGPSNLLNVIPPNGAFASWPAQWVLGAEYAVDIFFFMGAFLTFFVVIGREKHREQRTHHDDRGVDGPLAKPVDRARIHPISRRDHELQSDRLHISSTSCNARHALAGCKEIACAILLRWLRLVPLLAATFAIAWGVLPLLGRGPFWSTFGVYLRTCKGLWWTNFLFINNLVPFDNNALSQCRAETWYLATGEPHRAAAAQQSLSDRVGVQQPEVECTADQAEALNAPHAACSRAQSERLSRTTH